jgi:hypothetical protein
MVSSTVDGWCAATDENEAKCVVLTAEDGYVCRMHHPVDVGSSRKERVTAGGDDDGWRAPRSLRARSAD